MRINPLIFGVLVIAIFMGTILGFQAAGIWSVSGKVTADGEAIQPEAADLNTIKGWMTFDQIVMTYNVPLADLLAQFQLPNDTPGTTAIKDLETDLFSVTNLRIWLQGHQEGTAAVPAESSPDSEDPTAAPEPITAQPPVIENTYPTPTVHVASDMTITGKTTFQELLDWGVSKEAIQKAIDGDMPQASAIIKDYVTGKGLEFSPIKTALQAEVDQIK